MAEFWEFPKIGRLALYTRNQNENKLMNKMDSLLVVTDLQKMNIHGEIVICHFEQKINYR